ncbi:MAG: DoxX family protein [Fidelibacterota bacterium]
MDTLNKLNGYGHWLPRLSLGATFLFHGFGKFPMAEMMAKGMGMPIMMVYILALMEIAGGLLILWGGVGPDWATRVAGLIFAVIMVGAISKFHLANGWSFTSGWGDGTNHMGGAEFQTLIVAVSLFFAFKGNSVNSVNG